jgi:hypothetical protein
VTAPAVERETRTATYALWIPVALSGRPDLWRPLYASTVTGHGFDVVRAPALLVGADNNRYAVGIVTPTAHPTN